MREVINSTRDSLLPDEANENRPHKLRMLANDILHMERKEDKILTKTKEIGFEKEVLSFLSVLRGLIEGRGALKL